MKILKFPMIWICIIACCFLGCQSNSDIIDKRCSIYKDEGTVYYLGQPFRELKLDKVSLGGMELAFDGAINFVIKNNKVHEINLGSNHSNYTNFSINGGIIIGSKTEDILISYGEPTKIKEDLNYQYLYKVQQNEYKFISKDNYQNYKDDDLIALEFFFSEADYLTTITIRYLSN